MRGSAPWKDAIGCKGTGSSSTCTVAGSSAARKDLVDALCQGQGAAGGFFRQQKGGQRRGTQPYQAPPAGMLWALIWGMCKTAGTGPQPDLPPRMPPSNPWKKACDISFASKGCSRKGIWCAMKRFLLALHPVLPAANQTRAVAAVLPLYRHLLVLRGDGHHPLWRAQGGADGGLACIALQSFQQGRL